MIASPSPASIAHAVRALQQGQLLGLPTETVYGLAADACNGAAVDQIFTRKGRPKGHPLIVHVVDAAAATYFAADVPDFAAQLMQAFWPGPLTVILPRRAGVAETAAAGHPTIGLRCPSHPVAQQLLQAALAAQPPVYGVAAPSANPFGRISPTSAAHVGDSLGEDLLILDGGDCSVGIESTIVDCTRSRPIILRPGAITAAQVAQATGSAACTGEQPADDAPAPHAPGTLTAHYAPNAKVRLMDGQAIQAALDVLGSDAGHIALYTRQRMHAADTVLQRRMPAQPEAAAQQLFRTLRELDAAGVALIWVETPPGDPAWDGVRDRLQRAAASS